jgi:fibronectin type 3 domain-containing protein
MVAQNGLSVILEWLTPEEEDFSYYNVYRNDLDNSDPAMVFTTSDSFYVDLDMVDGSWEYWVTAVDSSGNESDASESVSLVLANEEEIAIPMVYNLEQNYPNPFNPSTQIRYALPEQTMVTISIYDMM